MATSTVSSEMEGLRRRFQPIWTAGDYDRFSRHMEGSARGVYGRIHVAPGARLLDVGCGSGQLALMAARDGLDLTSVDIAENSVARARARANIEGLPASFEQADAEALPFDDASFDVVVSLVGTMFAPHRIWSRVNSCESVYREERMRWRTGPH